MDTSLSWIKAYVPELDVTAQEYTDAMTLSGTKVEGYRALDADLENIVIGQILKIEQHPDADKLVVCRVDIGAEEPVQIVTGAPNVAKGQKVPVVLDGGRVAGNHDGKMTEGGIRIKKGKLRGVESNGMMCSIEELGQTKDLFPEAPDYGIYVFPDDAKVGDSAIKALGLDDVIFEYEITSNRVDCYSVIGIAREAAATFRKPFVPPKVEVKGSGGNVNDYLRVDVKDVDLCPRYVARVVKNIRLAPSPEWLRRRLAVNGIRPINNIVDITNYVMEEYGEPMHAYDLDTVKGHQILVRRAEKDEKFVTLDGKERRLDDEVLMICDAEKPIGIAGIMGGENSMITDDVKTMVFEAACFDGVNIRLSSKRIGLRTEASGKFEKGLDPNNAMEAIQRACQLVEELDAGDVVDGVIDVYNGVREEVSVPFDHVRINALLGTDIRREQMLEYFDRLELKYDEGKNVITAPTFRQDISCVADLAEEVARFYGYDNIPTTLPTGEATIGTEPFNLRIETVAREIAEFSGFSQGYCYSFESPKVFDKLLMAEDDPNRNAIKIANPLGEDFSIMRTSSVNGILTSLSSNYNRRNKNVRLYELGKIYLTEEKELTRLPDERTQFTLGFYGEGNFYTMKGVVEEFFEKAGMRERPIYDPNGGLTFLHPGRQAVIRYCGQRVGYLGEVHPQVTENYGIGTRAYIAVIDMPQIIKFATFDRKYEGIARFPAVNRDISMLVPKNVTAHEIEEIISGKGGKYLESYSLFDIYEGEQVKDGYKSMAYSITFRAADKTLEDNEVNSAMQRIIKGLEKIKCELRQ